MRSITFQGITYRMNVPVDEVHFVRARSDRSPHRSSRNRLAGSADAANLSRDLIGPLSKSRVQSGMFYAQSHLCPVSTYIHNTDHCLVP